MSPGSDFGSGLGGFDQLLLRAIALSLERGCCWAGMILKTFNYSSSDGSEIQSESGLASQVSLLTEVLLNLVTKKLERKSFETIDLLNIF